MELKEFIKGSLLDIMSAIHEAQLSWHEEVGKGAINPGRMDKMDDIDHHGRQVEFDVAVTVATGATAKANAGIKVVGLDFGGTGQLNSDNTSVSRIRFTVPIIPPVMVVKDHENEAPKDLV